MTERFSVYAVDPSDQATVAAVIRDCLKQGSIGANSPRNDPLLRCIALVQALGARCILRQHDVQDPDFMAEHSAYYSRWTTLVSRYCDRLHFFRVPPESDDPLAVIDRFAMEDYLGFITLRPISMSPIAASILLPPGGPNPCYLLSQDDFQVNIAGRSFVVHGTPFLQQDNAVGACAQASIWMALRTLRKKEGRAAYSPAQITTAATRFYVLGRTLPNRTGLQLQQVAEAVRSAGYSPHLLPLPTDPTNVDESIRRKKRVLYPYVESGIPVLLLLFPTPNDGHAVVLIGHGWESAPTTLIEVAKLSTRHWVSDLELFDAASWVEPFLIHNDNAGPYLDLPAQGPSYNLTHAQLATEVSYFPFYVSV